MYRNRAFIRRLCASPRRRQSTLGYPPHTLQGTPPRSSASLLSIRMQFRVQRFAHLQSGSWNFRLLVLKYTLPPLASTAAVSLTAARWFEPVEASASVTARTNFHIVRSSMVPGGQSRIPDDLKTCLEPGACTREHNNGAF